MIGKIIFKDVFMVITTLSSIVFKDNLFYNQGFFLDYNDSFFDKYEELSILAKLTKDSFTKK